MFRIPQTPKNFVFRLDLWCFQLLRYYWPDIQDAALGSKVGSVFPKCKVLDTVRIGRK